MRWSFRSVLAALNLAGRVPISGPTEPQKMQAKFDRIAGKEAVSLGGSTGNAIDFDAMCIDGAPFYNNGQDLFESEALIDLILSRPDPPRLFFLSTSPASQLYDNAIPGLANVYRRRYTYTFLQGEGEWGLIGDDWRQAMLAPIMPAVGQHLVEPWHIALLDALGRIPPPDPAVVHDTLSVPPEEADVLAKGVLAEWEAAAQAVTDADPTTPARTHQTLLRIADKVAAHGGQLVLVESPFIDEFNRPLQQADWFETDEFNALLRDLETRGAIVIDDWQNRATRYDAALFRDSAHLNAKGARIYSRRLEKILRSRGIVPEQVCRDTRPVLRGDTGI